MKIETTRLLLKKYAKSDLYDFYYLKSNPEIWRHSTFTPVTTIREAQGLLEELIHDQKKSDFSFHALFLKPDTFIGEAGILNFNSNVNRCVLGYNLLPQFWNKGYATEITKALVAYAFIRLVAERVEGLAMKKNLGSCRVLEKAGMKLEGVLRHFTKVNGVYEDVCYYAMIASDFKN